MRHHLATDAIAILLVLPAFVLALAVILPN
jgi:hypothetical protein